MHGAHKHLIGALAYLFLQALSLFVSPSAYGQYNTKPIRVIYIDRDERETLEFKASYFRAIYPRWRDAFPFQDFFLSYDSIYARGFLENEQPDTAHTYKKVGPYITFYRNMKLEQSGQFDSLGRRYGVWNFMNARGDTIKRQRYLADSIVASTCFNADGSILHEGRDCGEVYPIPLNIDVVKKNIRYPNGLRKEGAAGRVVLRILVLEDGILDLKKVQKVFVTHPEFYKAVFAQLDKLRFTPGQIHGKIKRYWVTIPFDFKMR